MTARRARLEVFLNGNAVTEDLSGDILSLSYNDTANSEEVDDIDLGIQNRSKKWLRDWFPETGDKLRVRILTEGWTGALECGEFTVDDVGFSGRPLQLSIKGVAMPADESFSEVRRSRSWEKATLSKIIGTLADNSSIPLDFKCSYNPELEFVSQQNKSDKVFLYELCQKHGLGLKLYSGRMVIFDQEELEATDGVLTLTEADFLSWSCESTLCETAYTGCSVKYTNSKGQLVEYLHTRPAKTAKVYYYETPVDNIAQAQRVAVATLRRLNMEEVTFSGTLPGNTFLVAGMTVRIKGFYNFDGKYYVDKAAHSVSGGGYTVALEMHREVAS